MTQPRWPMPGTTLIAPLFVLLWGARPGAGWSPGPWAPVLALPLVALAWLAWSSRFGSPASGSTSPALAASGARSAPARWLDPLLAAVVVYGTVFRAPESIWPAAALFAPVAAALVAVARVGAPAWLATATILLAGVGLLPRVYAAWIVAQVSKVHALDVDHRFFPDGHEINAHGARFKGEARDLRADDFVVLFMGDSFTFGFNLPYEQAYPYQLEALAAQTRCEAPVRVVNMGWTSSSPLLSLRLAREVAFEYRPDLVVYTLDMTDFHDDLRYEQALREQGDFEVDVGAALRRVVAARWATSGPGARVLDAIAGELRGAEEPDATGAQPLVGRGVFPGKQDRYFATRVPLRESRAAIERGVMKNLAALNALGRDVLGVPMAVVLFPRAYQYAPDESPRNWEAKAYAGHAHLRAPFEYFAERAPDLPYPVFDLFDDFAAAEAGVAGGAPPLHFETDPHWTRAGAQVAASAVWRELLASGLVPCSDD